MPKSDERYIAYQLLRELDAITSSIMAQVAYGRFGNPAWLAAQVAHREAFEKWMLHAATLSPPRERFGFIRWDVCRGGPRYSFESAWP